MTEKELKKLTRADLLEMLIEQSREMQQLRKELQSLQQEQQQRELRINKAGSIAEAALQLSGVFEAAEEAGKQYLENIRLLSLRQEDICAQMERETQEKCRTLLTETRRACAVMESETRKKCNAMLNSAGLRPE